MMTAGPETAQVRQSGGPDIPPALQQPAAQLLGFWEIILQIMLNEEIQARDVPWINAQDLLINLHGLLRAPGPPGDFRKVQPWFNQTRVDLKGLIKISFGRGQIVFPQINGPQVVINRSRPGVDLQRPGQITLG